MIGKSIDRYQILEQIGMGGMAVVYKAFDTRLEREVAIKIIRKEAFSPEALERVLKRFEREAKSLARLSHINIINIFDYGTYENAPYLVMEYMSGGSLKERLDAPMGFEDAIELITPIAKALDHSHNQGIIHRDIKPSNIIFDINGVPKITDFGIAQLLDTEDSVTLTATGVGIGTPEYMAPEQGRGTKTDARADVYSLSVVLYEMVTGKKPFEGDTPLDIMIKHINDPLPPPTSIVSGLPRKLEQIIGKGLAKQPADRYQSMGAFADALDEITHFGDRVRVPGDRDETRDEIDLSLYEESPRRKAKDRHSVKDRLKPIWFWILGVVLVVGLILGGLWVSSRPSDALPIDAVATVTETTPPLESNTSTIAPTSRPSETPTPTATNTLTSLPSQTPTIIDTVAPTETSLPSETPIGNLPVPDVVGLDSYTAGLRIQAAGFQVEKVSEYLPDLEPDIVFQQNPAAGASLGGAETVTISYAVDVKQMGVFSFYLDTGGLSGTEQFDPIDLPGHTWCYGSMVNYSTIEAGVGGYLTIEIYTPSGDLLMSIVNHQSHQAEYTTTVEGTYRIRAKGRNSQTDFAVFCKP